MVGRPAWCAAIALGLLMVTGCAPREYVQFELEPAGIVNPVGELQELFALAAGVNVLVIGDDQMLLASMMGPRTIAYRTLRQAQVFSYRGKYFVEVFDVSERAVFRVSFATLGLAKRFCHVLAAAQIRAESLQTGGAR